MITRAIFIVSLLVASPSAQALSGFLTSGYGRGGEALSDFTGGTYGTHAGDGLYLVGGFAFAVSPTKPHAFEGQIGIGYLFQADDNDKENGTSWSRIPDEATYFYRLVRRRQKVIQQHRWQRRNLGHRTSVHGDQIQARSGRS